jgi:hypothetical protein
MRSSRTPVVLFVYARPDTTRRLVEIVREANPPLVLVVADGPHQGGVEDASRCAAARDVVEQAAWRCEVLTNYADENLGLNRRVETGLDWAFDLVDEAIVLEDDCLPHPTFFRFCDELLDRFRHEPRVLSIGGSCFLPTGGDAGYRFSRHQHIWGWATWQRAWRNYDPLLTRWPELRDGGWLDELLSDRDAVQYWTYVFERTYAGRLTWDYAWLLACWLVGGVSAVPRRNLVTNVGFRDDATNTRPEHGGPFADIPAVAVDFPLRHPAEIAPDVAADWDVERLIFSGNVARLFARIRARRGQLAAT